MVDETTTTTGTNNTSSTDTTSTTEEKEVVNKSNDYTPYWGESEEEHRMSTDTPNVYILISKQKRGTETEATPYDNQDEGSEGSDDSNS